VTGYTAGTAWSCSGGGTFVTPDKITLANAEQATCTISNNDNPPSLKLVKTVINDNGRTATSADWTLTATGTSAGFSDAGNSTTFHNVTAGVQYTLSESAVTGYAQLGDWVCTNGGTFATPDKITLALAEQVTCTVTNDDGKSESSLNTDPWIYPNDKAVVAAATGQTDITGSVTFKLYGATDGTTPKTASENCTANAATGLLYSETVSLPAATGASKTVNTSNPGTTGSPNSVKVESSATVYWRVSYTGDTNHFGRLSNCVENINVGLTGATGGTNVP
jgi:hypothetical protein